MKEFFTKTKGKVIDIYKKIKILFIKLKDKIVNIYQTKKKIVLISILLIILIIIALIICSIITKPKNINNNLNNMGFVSNKGSYIYYIGFKDDNIDGIYKAKLNGENKEKINDGYCYYLNVEGKYIYYIDVQTYGLVKMNLNTKKKQTLVENIDLNPITLKNGWVYYFKDYVFYRIKIDGTNEQKLADADKHIYSYQIVDNWIYYSYSNNENYSLAKMKTNGDKDTKINDDVGTNFQVNEDTIYYIYSKYNSETYSYSYDLYKIKTNGKNKKKIKSIEGNLSAINISNSGVYYVKENEDKYKIYKLSFNGKTEKEILEIGDRSYINIVKDYIYYLDDNNNGETAIYRINTNEKDKIEI